MEKKSIQVLCKEGGLNIATLEKYWDRFGGIVTGSLKEECFAMFDRYSVTSNEFILSPEDLEYIQEGISIPIIYIPLGDHFEYIKSKFDRVSILSSSLYSSELTETINRLNILYRFRSKILYNSYISDPIYQRILYKRRTTSLMIAITPSTASCGCFRMFLDSRSSSITSCQFYYYLLFFYGQL